MRGSKSRGFLMASLATAAATVAGCSSTSPTIPDVKGKRLDEAKQAIFAAGIKDSDMNVDGGAFANVSNATDWYVCSTDPAVGARSDRVKVVVKRPGDGCGGEKTTTEGSTASRSSLIPDVTCQKLSVAKTSLNVAGVSKIETRDATGEGRTQIIDSNWIVVAQDPTPGSKSGGVRLDVVKEGERPCSPTTTDASPPSSTSSDPASRPPTTAPCGVGGGTAGIAAELDLVGATLEATGDGFRVTLTSAGPIPTTSPNAAHFWYVWFANERGGFRYQLRIELDGSKWRSSIFDGETSQARDVSAKPGTSGATLTQQLAISELRGLNDTFFWYAGTEGAGFASDRCPPGVGAVASPEEYATFPG